MAVRGSTPPLMFKETAAETTRAPSFEVARVINLLSKGWCRRSDARPNIPLCRFVSGSVPLSILNTVPIVPVAPYRRV